ncbi:MAG: lipoate--protein ligase family protein [DPANN group archaeon]|nr:lipoate--protein ligase family protein [DPANN group archaeon]
MKWRIISPECNDSTMNMALDESVMEAIRDKHSPPTIRFYRWKNSSVTIGCFQNAKKETHYDKCIEDHVQVIRRITGGGAVYNDKDGEITYSLIAPESMMPNGITESYQLICGYVVNALGKINISAHFKPINDIIVTQSGKKISGNAQTRRQGVLLQHGTLLYDLNVEKMFSYLNVGREKISDKDIAQVEERVTCIRNLCEKSIEETAQALAESFSEDKEHYIGDFTDAERTRAWQLVEEKYANDSWNLSR